MSSTMFGERAAQGGAAKTLARLDSGKRGTSWSSRTSSVKTPRSPSRSPAASALRARSPRPTIPAVDRCSSNCRLRRCIEPWTYSTRSSLSRHLAVQRVGTCPIPRTLPRRQGGHLACVPRTAGESTWIWQWLPAVGLAECHPQTP